MVGSPTTLKSLLPLFVLALAALVAVLAALSVGLEGVHGQAPPTTPSVSTVAITSKPRHGQHQRGNRYGTTQAEPWCVLGQEDAPCLEYQLGSPAGAFGWECLRQGPLPT